MLNSFGYPATFFVVSDAISRREEFWWDQLEVIFRSPEFDYKDVIGLLATHSENKPEVEALGDGKSLGSYLMLWQKLRRLPAEERRHCFADLRDRMGLQTKMRQSHRPMTAAELRTLAANSLFEIGGHTVTHPSLPMLTEAEQEHEIVSGSHFLEAILGKRLRSFSYPFGDWRPITCDIVRHAGFDCAVTGMHKRVKSGVSAFELPRRQVVN